jgi:hypothetical protein
LSRMRASASTTSGWSTRVTVTASGLTDLRSQAPNAVSARSRA